MGDIKTMKKKTVEQENELGDTPTDAIAGMHMPDPEGSWRGSDPGENSYTYDKKQIAYHERRLTGRKRKENGLSKGARGLLDMQTEQGKSGEYFEEDETGLFGNESPEDLPTNKPDRNIRYESSTGSSDVDLSDFSFLGFGKESKRNYEMNNELIKLSNLLDEIGSVNAADRIDLMIIKEAVTTPSGWSSRPSSSASTSQQNLHRACTAYYTAIDTMESQNYYSGGDEGAAEDVINAVWARYNAFDGWGDNDDALPNALISAARSAEPSLTSRPEGYSSWFEAVVKEGDVNFSNGNSAFYGNSDGFAIDAKNFWGKMKSAIKKNRAAETAAETAAATGGTALQDDMDPEDKMGDAPFFYLLTEAQKTTAEQPEADFLRLEWGASETPPQWRIQFRKMRDLSVWLEANSEKRSLVTEEWIEELSELGNGAYKDGFQWTTGAVTEYANKGKIPHPGKGYAAYYDSWEGWTDSWTVMYDLLRNQETVKASGEFAQQQAEGRSGGGGGGGGSRAVASIVDLSGGVITDSDTGNKFRTWVYSDAARARWASSNNFDSSHTVFNSRAMRSAWATYGNQYKQYLQVAGPDELLAGSGTGSVARRESVDDLLGETAPQAPPVAAPQAPPIASPQAPPVAATQPEAGWTIENVGSAVDELYRGVRIGKNSERKVRRTTARALRDLGRGSTQEILNYLSGRTPPSSATMRYSEVYNALMDLKEQLSGGRKSRAARIDRINALSKTSDDVIDTYKKAANNRRRRVSEDRKKLYDSI